MRKLKTFLFGIFVGTIVSATPFSYANAPFNTDTGTSNDQTHEEVVIEYYGRNALSKLDNATALVYAYDKIVECVENSNEEIAVWDEKNEITQAEFETVMDAYRRDHGEHFWLDSVYTLTSSSKSVTHFSPDYLYSGEELEYKKAEFENAVTEILAGVTAEMSEFEKELYLHDELAKKAVYVLGADNAHNAYGAIVEGKTVCEGYAEGLQYLLQRAGIQSFLAIGASLNPTSGESEPHAWNYVRLGERYYHVDLTWNDQSSYLYHAYFNQPDATIKVDHVLSEAVFDLPVCESDDMEYFKVSGGVLTTYTVESIAQLLRDNDFKASVYTESSAELLAWFNTESNVLAIAKALNVQGKFSYGHSKLGNEVVLFLETCIHEWKNATCVTPKTCILCSDTEGFAAGHDDNVEFERDENGHWKTCGVCSQTFKEGVHLYSDWKITQKPTETQDGEKAKTCVCGHSITESIAAGTVVDEPTEEKDDPFAGCLSTVSLSGLAALFPVFVLIAKTKKRKQA